VGNNRIGKDDALGATLGFSERDSHPSARRLVNVGARGHEIS